MRSTSTSQESRMAAVLSLAPERRELTPHRQTDLHRQARPRTARCTRDAAVYRRRRLLAAALGLGLVLTVARAGAALGGDSTSIAGRDPHVETVVVQPGDT